MKKKLNPRKKRTERMSLSCKLRTFKRGIYRKHKPHLAMDDNQTRLVTRYMPKSVEELRVKCMMDECQISAYGNQLLDITRTHERDQEQFKECIKEIKAFADGGLAGISMLNRVWTRIVEYYGVSDEKYDVLSLAGVGVGTDDGMLFKRKVAQMEEEDPLTVPNSVACDTNLTQPLFKRRKHVEEESDGEM